MSVFTLPSAITIQNATSLGEILGALDSTQPNTLDASHTEVITTPGVQLLLAFSKTLEQTKNILTITGQSAAFEAAFTDLGFIPFAKGQ